MTFAKWSITSQISSIVDTGTSTLLFELGGAWLTKPVSKAIGQICGAIVNCSINYKWAFRSKTGSSKIDIAAVVVKYALVWLGSVTLNVAGSTLLSNYFDKIATSLQWLQQFNISEAVSFLVAQVIVSLLVSIFWNFILQKYFVYRDVPKHETIVKIAKSLKLVK